MKVIGAGFGRTGTSSLMVALEQLGFGPCYHMSRLFTHSRDAKFWMAAVQNRLVDWQFELRNYQSTLDFPACRFYKELLSAFPDAKVLLSVRDAEAWYDSTRATIYPASFPPRWLMRIIPSLRQVNEVTHAAIWDGIFHGQFENREYAISIYKQHIEEVKASMPAEKLLIFDVKSGWEPLCTFLDVPIPTTSFPHQNDRASMEQAVRVMDWLKRLEN